MKINVQYIPSITQLVFYYCAKHDNCIFLAEQEAE